MLQQTVDQFHARVVELARGIGIARQQHLRFDMNEQGSGVNELSRDINVELLHVLNILQVLLGDFRDRDVVDIDVLFADEVEQQVEWPS